MKRNVSGIILSFSLLLLPLIAAYSSGQQETAESTTETATDYRKPENLVSLVENGDREYHLVDVRTPEEYASGHIPTAENTPFDVIGDNLPTEDRDALIIVYCRSGNRSGTAMRTLEDLGFTNVVNFGGVSRWPKELEK